MVVKQYDILLINLDPAIGHEIKKVRPCVVISPDEMNRNIETMIIAPMTSHGHAYPTRVLSGSKVKKDDRARSDSYRRQKRLIKKMGRLAQETVREVKAVIQEMLVD